MFSLHFGQSVCGPLNLDAAILWLPWVTLMAVAMVTFVEELCTDDFFFSPSGVHHGHNLSRRNTEVVGVSTLVNTKVTFPPRLVLKKRIAVGWLGPLFSGVPL